MARTPPSRTTGSGASPSTPRPSAARGPSAWRRCSKSWAFARCAGVTSAASGHRSYCRPRPRPDRGPGSSLAFLTLLRATLPADAEDGDVVQVGEEARRPLQRLRQDVQVRLFQGADLAADAADEVVVAVAADPLEEVLAAAEVDLANQAALFGRGQRAVDGGGVDVREGSAHFVENLGGGDVAAGMAHAAEDEDALRRYALARGAQHRRRVRLTAHRPAQPSFIC